MNISIYIYDSTKAAGEEARQQLHKNAASNLEQVLMRQHPTRHQLYDHLLSRKLFKLDEPDMQGNAGEAGTNS